MFGRKRSEIKRLENENSRLLALNRKEQDERKMLTEKINNLQKNRPHATDEDIAQGMRDAIYSCTQRIAENGGIEYIGFGGASTTGVMALSQLVTTYALFKVIQTLGNNQNAGTLTRGFEHLPEPANAVDTIADTRSA